MLRMGPRGENGFHHVRGRWTVVGRPPDEPLWCPFRVVPVRFRPVRRDRTVTPLIGRALVAGHACALVKDFHDLGTQPHIELLLHQRVRHRVGVPVDLDVGVDVHTDLFPLGIGIGLHGQRLESWVVEGLAQTLS